MITFSNKRRLICRSLLVVALVLFSLVSVSGCDNGTTNYVARSLPEMTFGDDAMFTEAAQGYASIEVASGFSFKHDAIEQTVDISNPDCNACTMVASLYLADGTLLFETPQIAPGGSIQSIALSTTLARGVYKNALLVYDCYSASGALTRCEFVVEITSY